MPTCLSALVTERTLKSLETIAGERVTTKNIDTILNDPFINSTVKSLHVVNDAAERGVALMQRLQARCKDEEQKQALLKVVHEDRKTVKRTKAGVSAKFERPTSVFLCQHYNEIVTTFDFLNGYF